MPVILVFGLCICICFSSLCKSQAIFNEPCEEMKSNGQELEIIKKTMESQVLLLKKEMNDFDSQQKYIQSVLEIQKTQFFEAFERLRYMYDTTVQSIRQSSSLQNSKINTLESQQNDSIRSIKQLSTALDSLISIRFVNGSAVTSRYGRVEVLYAGVWGTICDDAWDNKDAKVICKMKGYNSGGIAYRSATYGEGSGQIWLDDVQCTGTESSLMECSKRPFGQHNCRHHEDAGVSCN
ncbi:deleted in malignant brain tumors 1 protein-like [Saccostrea cucullata]|uniref:deleted in malignant brain tumors 1 protein-like n=1 Tax=Saccostrea cuccullata TaxID=36930 RepID=UPI002ED13638